MSRWLLNTSRDRDSTTSVDNLRLCSVTHTVRCFLMYRGNLLCFCLCPLPFVLSLGTTEKPYSILFAPSHQVFINVCIHLKGYCSFFYFLFSFCGVRAGWCEEGIAPKKLIHLTYIYFSLFFFPSNKPLSSQSL